MQYLDLLRDAARAMALPAIPATVVETQNALTGEVYAKVDSRLQRHEVKSRVYEKKAKLRKTGELRNAIVAIAGVDEPDPGDEDEAENGGGEVGGRSEDREEEDELADSGVGGLR